jgi:TonB family protein
MLSSSLKRILPFALTLLIGLALGGLPGLFRGRTEKTEGFFTSSRTYQYRHGGGCSSRKGMLYGVGGGVGRLIAIRRQTEDGNWVSVRPVGPEIYRETTRPAIIRSRPFAYYTDEARQERVTGTTTLEAVLSTSGEVTDVKPLSQLPDGLTLQAVRAAEQLDFEPALRDGRRVEQRIQLEFSFDL